MEQDERSCPRCAEVIKLAAKVCKHCGYDFVTGHGPETHVFPIPAKKSKLKGCLIAVVVIIGGVTLIGILAPNQPHGSTTPEVSAPSSSPARKVTPRELEAAYAANEAAAQKEYGEQLLDVTGNIESIQLGLGDKPFVVFRGNSLLGPQAQFDDDSQPKASSLHKGEKLHLICKGVSEVIGTPMLSDCSII
jgi:hypothetical protein